MSNLIERFTEQSEYILFLLVMSGIIELKKKPAGWNSSFSGKIRESSSSDTN
jgi:hypothetical protein